MKGFLLSFLLLYFLPAAFSQKLYYIYLQTDPAQPFFVRVGEKVHSSSASGYLILSRLQDSSYLISVGFPGNKWPEQKFSLSVSSKDHGYLLKNFGEKGWGLYDMETSEIKKPVQGTGLTPKTEPREVSAFTEILSKAANDPSLKEKQIEEPEKKTIAKTEDKPKKEPGKQAATDSLKTGTIVAEKKFPEIKEEKKQDSVAALVKAEIVEPGKKDTVEKKADTLIAKKKETEIGQPKPAPVAEYRRSNVTRLSEASTTMGLGLTFIDDYGDGNVDTVRIFIPNPRPEKTVREQPKEEIKFLDISTADTLSVTAEKKDSVAASAGLKNDCAAIADEDDFLKLRKKMAGGKSEEDMVDEAKRFFKLKCYTVEQVKNLGALFLKDAGKYRFFDAAYLHVSDPEKFPSLASELKDEYYLNRFNAMLR